MNKYLVYFKTIDDNYRCLYSDDHYESLKTLPEANEYHHYEVFKGFEATDEGLMTFKMSLIKWNEELKHNGYLKIDWFKYYTNFSAVELTFHRLAKGKYENHEPIDKTEYKWIESTHNGGLTYCNVGIHDSYGYDMQSFYPSLMSQYKFILPTKRGSEIFLTMIPEEISLGFYRVKITSSHKHATKLFAFSKDHVYNNISLDHALELKDEFDFNIELIIDDQPNAYIYPKGSRASSVFGKWFDTLMNIKIKFPKNKLIKHLMSSLWGSLSKGNNIMKTWDDIEKEGLKIGMGDDADYKIADYIKSETQEYYKLTCMHQPYKHNFRLKSFLTSYGRVKIAEVIMTDINSCIRVHTDGVVFNKKMNLNFQRLIVEDKTTGKINWKGINNYIRLSSSSM
jgi:hypothetical protein